MATSDASFPRFTAIAGMALLGAIIGLCAGLGNLAPLLKLGIEQTTYFPLPHQIPKYPDGISLRYAMVHDVLHERYPRHGTAYYTERNRQAREALRQEKGKVYGDGKPSPLYFSLLDDLG